jgi:hypothetical protein
MVFSPTLAASLSGSHVPANALAAIIIIMWFGQ